MVQQKWHDKQDLGATIMASARIVAVMKILLRGRVDSFKTGDNQGQLLLKVVKL